MYWGQGKQVDEGKMVAAAEVVVDAGWCNKGCGLRCDGRLGRRWAVDGLARYETG